MASSPQKKPNKPQAAKPTPAPENTPAENTGIKRHILDITDAEPFWNVWNADIFKKAFYISLAAMLLMLWISGYNVGYHQDEMDMNAYGKANIAYYMSGGKDTTYLGCENCYGNYHVDKLLRYYGSAYEYMPVLINKITGLDKTKEEFNVRHLIAQLCSIICLLFCGLIAKRFAGWRAAIITIWMLFCSPVFFGHSLFNSKDIPFCTGYVATLYYILVFIDELPSPTWRTSIYMMLAFAFTMGTRVGGLLLFGYLGIFSLGYLALKWKEFLPLPQKLLPPIIKMATILVGALVITVIAWPYALKSPFTNIIETLNVVKKFPTVVKLAFDGEYMDSTNVPNYYLPKFMSITIPVFILFTFIAGAVFLLIKNKKYNILGIGLLIFSIIFPISYAIMTQVSLYSAWRHFLFVYPSMCILASIAINDLLDFHHAPYFKWGVVGVCLLCMAKPIMWMIKNHPYEYTYFNAMAGGFKKAYYEYETDYWEITAKKVVDHLMETESRMRGKDSIYVVTNMESFVKGYIAKNYPGTRARVTNIGVLSRYGQKWTYGVFNTIFLRPEFLEKNFPLCNTVFAENIDGMPVTTLVKDTIREDWQAQEAFTRGEYNVTDSLLRHYLTYVCPANKGLLGLLALTQGNMNKCREGIALAEQCLAMNISPYANYDALCGLGVAYGNLQKFDSAIEKLQIARKIFPAYTSAPQILEQVLIYKQKVERGEIPRFTEEQLMQRNQQQSAPGAPAPPPANK